MIDIKFNNENYNVKNNLNELTIKEFEEICKILNGKTENTIDKWIKILIYLGLSEDCIDNFDLADFIKVIKEFNLTSVDNPQIVKEFILNNITYRAYDTELRLTVKETALIETFINKNDNRYLGELIAVIYKNVDADRSINYDKSHIHFKAELFRKELKADIVLPIISYLSKKLIKDLTVMTELNGQTNTAE